MRNWIDMPAWIGAVFLAGLLLTGCVANRPFHPERDDYLQQVPLGDAGGNTCDLAIVEFDDQGQFWMTDQIDDTVALIRRRNDETERGVLVVAFVHGWQNNADISQNDKDLARFKQQLVQVARGTAGAGAAGDGRPDRVVGVYLGWRGATTRVPVLNQLTFWDRKLAAERVVSLNHSREALLRVMLATRQHPGSKVVINGHSMGGMIVGDALGSALTTMLLLSDGESLRLPADLVVLTNPARDALKAWQFVDFLKRHAASVRVEGAGGAVLSSNRPILVSITSEADWATGGAYPAGRTLATLFGAFRGDGKPGAPTQRDLVTHSEGHVDELISHRAEVVDGRVVLKRVPGAYNDTPFWNVKVTQEICADHGDLNNPRLGELIAGIMEANHTYDTDARATIMLREPGAQ